jgi:hypothetical protein
MQLLSFFSRLLVLPATGLMGGWKKMNSGMDRNTEISLMFSLTRHTQVTPSPQVPEPSTTMLATMPCTPFPGRSPHAIESIITDHLSTSTVDPTDNLVRMMLRRRLEKRVAISTFGGYAMRKFGREMKMVEIVFVEWLVLCWLEIEEGKG